MGLLARYTHWLHTQWPAGTVETLPVSGEDGATSVPGVRIVGTAPHKAAVLSFAVAGIHPHDIAAILDSQGKHAEAMTYYDAFLARAPRTLGQAVAFVRGRMTEFSNAGVVAVPMPASAQ